MRRILLVLTLTALAVAGCPQEVRFALTLSTEGSGAVAASPAASDYAPGAVVLLTATPAEGWRFDHWEGSLAGSDNPATISMSTNRAITAAFLQQPLRKLTPQTIGNGSLSLDPAGGVYCQEADVTLTAAGQDGWIFDHWLGDLSGAENPTTLAIDDEPEITAVFRDEQGMLMQYGYGVLLCMDVSPDGSRLISGGYDGNVRMWHTASGQLLRTFYGHGSLVTSVSFDASGDMFASGSFDGKVTLWDAGTGAKTNVLTFSSVVYSGALSPDATRVLVATQDDPPELVEVATGATLATLTGHAGLVFLTAYSPDGARLATAGEDLTAKLWDTAGSELASFTHAMTIRDLEFSPDSSQLLTGCDDTLARLWQTGVGAPLEVYTGHIDPVTSVAFSPDGGLVAGGSQGGTTRLWNKNTGAFVQSVDGHERAMVAAGFAASTSELITAGSDGRIIRWNLATGNQLLNYPGHTREFKAAVFSPDGKLVLAASTDKRALLYEAENGQFLRAFIGHTDAVRDVAFSPDGALILTGSEDETARTWVPETGAVQTSFVGHTEEVYAVAFNPDGSEVATGSADSHGKIWHAGTGVEMADLAGHGADVLDIAYSHDGSFIATASADNTAMLWNADTGAWIRTFAAHAGPVNSVAFSQDDSRLLTAGEDAKVVVWDVATAAVDYSFSTTLPARDAVFTPGETYAAVADPYYIKTWKIDTGAAISQIVNYLGVFRSVVYAPDNLSILAASEDGAARRYAAP